VTIVAQKRHTAKWQAGFKSSKTKKEYATAQHV